MIYPCPYCETQQMFLTALNREQSFVLGLRFEYHADIKKQLFGISLRNVVFMTDSEWLRISGGPIR